MHATRQTSAAIGNAQNAIRIAKGAMAQRPTNANIAARRATKVISVRASTKTLLDTKNAGMDAETRTASSFITSSKTKKEPKRKTSPGGQKRNAWGASIWR